MKAEDLKNIKYIQKYLDSINYPDSYRIAKEIVSYISEELYHQESIDSILKQITNGKPWEYIKGWSEFLGNRFFVTKDTLIPRIETEQLVQMATEHLISNSKEIRRVIDVGTGSGAIICSIFDILKREKVLGDIRGIATDISETALNVAQRNAEKLNVGGCITFENTDLIAKRFTFERSDIVVANLPYIPTKDYYNLDISVKDYEPKNALDGGVDGLKQINRLLDIIKRSSHKPDSIYLEVDPSQTDILKERLKSIETKYIVRIVKDIYDRDRFVVANLPQQV